MPRALCHQFQHQEHPCAGVTINCVASILLPSTCSMVKCQLHAAPWMTRMVSQGPRTAQAWQRRALRGQPSCSAVPHSHQPSFIPRFIRGAGSPPEQLPSCAWRGPGSVLPLCLRRQLPAAVLGQGEGVLQPWCRPRQAGCFWGQCFALPQPRKAEHPTEIQGRFQSSLCPGAVGGLVLLFLAFSLWCWGRVGMNK